MSPIVAYVLAALRVIAQPHDPVIREAFFAAMLPTPLLQEVRTRARATRSATSRESSWRWPNAGRRAIRERVRLALSRYRNLGAVERAHASLDALVADLLSQNIKPRSPLEERHDELSDPADHPDVVRLADRLRSARAEDRFIDLPRLGGVEIALKALLAQIGVTARIAREPVVDLDLLTPDDLPSLGVVLGTFKAAQLLEIGDASDAFRDFTAVDVETTGRDVGVGEIVEVAAVRVRDGRV